MNKPFTVDNAKRILWNDDLNYDEQVHRLNQIALDWHKQQTRWIPSKVDFNPDEFIPWGIKKNERVNSLLVAALRYLTQDQLIALKDSLIERCPKNNGWIPVEECAVSGELLSDVDYWKQRCLLAENCLEKSPCDPDITMEQIKAHNYYHKFIAWAGLRNP